MLLLLYSLIHSPVLLSVSLLEVAQLLLGSLNILNLRLAELALSFIVSAGVGELFHQCSVLLSELGILASRGKKIYLGVFMVDLVHVSCDVRHFNLEMFSFINKLIYETN